VHVKYAAGFPKLVCLSFNAAPHRRRRFELVPPHENCGLAVQCCNEFEVKILTRVNAGLSCSSGAKYHRIMDLLFVIFVACNGVGRCQGHVGRLRRAVAVNMRYGYL
jgi:hypothetical protein